MKKIMVIFKKEFTDTLRDRRTIMMMIVVPLLVMPLIFHLMSTLGASHAKKTREKIIKVGIVSNGNAAAFTRILEERKDMTLSRQTDPDQAVQMLKDKKLDFVVVFDKQFDEKVSGRESGGVTLHFKSSTESRILKNRIKKLFDHYRDELMATRLEALHLEKSFIKPLEITEIDVASSKEKLGEVLGGLLPYLFVIFCFMGAMYPAIDLAAGEKERSTLETLLTAPASRLQIVLGKFLVITCVGFTSALLAIVSLFFAAKSLSNLPAFLMDTIMKLIEWQSISLLLSLLLPLSIFFAAALLSFSIYAKSFKEAQSIITPLNLIVFIPAMVGMMPGIKLDTVTALIPVLNVSLASKEIISGTIQTGLLLEVYLSLLLLAAGSLIFCTIWFKREDVIFRGI